MHKRSPLAVAAAMAALLLAAGAAEAGKKSGTLNIAIAEQIEGISEFNSPSGESQLYTRVVMDRLFNLDHDTGKILPSLGISWKKINSTTFEIRLRRDITFHDSSKFDADDVVYTINWASNPKTRFRLKGPRFGWIKGAEKLGSHKVRLLAKRPFSLAKITLAVGVPILPSDMHSALAKKSTFGRKAVGSGAYKLVSLDENTGIILVARDNFRHANKSRPVPSIKRITIRPVIDEQTRMALMLTDEIDLTRVASRDTAAAMKANAKFRVTPVNGLQYNYLYLDAADRTGIGALKKLKVRQAIAHAINRAEIKANVIVGGDGAFELKALCIPFQTGCGSTTTPYPFDPAKAKQLLAEAGHASGLTIELTAISRTRGVAEAISGYLRKVGIGSSIRQVSFPVYRKLQRGGKLQALVNIFGSGGVPDTARVLSFHFNNKGRDYAKDAHINQIARLTTSTFDAGKRNALFIEAMDIINRQAYIIPIAAAPQVFLHSKDVAVPSTTINGYGAVVNQLKWK